jgi:outer membrane protein assembly factor BamB
MYKRNLLYIFLLGGWSLFILNPANAQIEKWPQFRGVNCSGIAEEGQSPPVKLDTATNLLWKTAVPEGHSSPCIWDNQIFLTGVDRDSKSFLTFCLDRKTGKKNWLQTIRTDTIEKVHAVSCPANATVATDGERVYAYFGSYGLICYDMDGSEKWKLPLPFPKSRHGMGSSPIVCGDRVILNCCNDQNDPRIIAIDRHSGNLVWKASIPPTDSYFGNEGYSTPVVWDNQIIIYRRSMIEAYDIGDGSLIWWFATTTGGVSTPLVSNGIVYVNTFTSSGDPEWEKNVPSFKTLITENDINKDSVISKEEFPQDLYIVARPDAGEEFGGTKYLSNFFGMFDADQNNTIDSIEWKNVLKIFEEVFTEHGLVAINPEGKGNITFSGQLWKHVKDVPEVPSPLYHLNRIYMIKNGGIVTCLNAKTGSLIFREKLGSTGTYFSSPIIAGDKIYIGSRRGIISVLEAADSFNLLSQYDLNENIMATPVIVDSKLYFRGSDFLYAFGN